jgi:predicted membrane protein
MTSRSRFTPQVLLGLMVIAVGVLFTLDNLNVIDASLYLRYWPIALVAFGLMKLWHARREGVGWAGGVFFTAVGAWMLFERVAYIRVDIQDFWPLMLVCVGGYLVWRGVARSARPRPLGADAHLSAVAILSGLTRGSNSPAFSGGDLTAVMGGCEIDLRQASIASGTTAVVDVFAFWGGIDIRVPEDWTVITRVTPLLGGVEDQTRPAQAAASKRVEIRGTAIMGGIVIKN